MNKYTFTYEYVQGERKVASVYVAEDVVNIEDILDAVQNFLASAGYKFGPNQVLTVVELEEGDKNASQSRSEGTREGSVQVGLKEA